MRTKPQQLDQRHDRLGPLWTPRQESQRMRAHLAARWGDNRAPRWLVGYIPGNAMRLVGRAVLDLAVRYQRKLVHDLPAAARKFFLPKTLGYISDWID